MHLADFCTSATHRKMSTSFGELVLILGDAHIPERAGKIAAAFKRMLVPNKMQHVICTGNIGSSNELWNEIQQLAPVIHCVAGDHDKDYNLFPETSVIQVGQFRIGVIHGHQLIPNGSKEAVEHMRRKLHVDILVTGHTHQSAVFDENDGFYHINPGSITGAFSPLTEKVTPSFILLAVQDTKVVCYVYELINDEVEVSKTEFAKKMNSIDPPNESDNTLLDRLLK